MVPRTHKFLTALGVLFIILSFALLPWLVIAPQGYLDTNVQQVIDWLLEALQHWGPPPVQAVIGFLEQSTHLQGWKLLLSPAAGWGLKTLIVAPAALATFSLLWELLNMWLREVDLATIVSVAQAVLAILLLALLVGHIPTIERLGATHSYLMGLTVALFGVRIGWGLWGTLLGLALLAAGALLRFLGTSGGAGRRPTRYRRYPYH